VTTKKRGSGTSVTKASEDPLFQAQDLMYDAFEASGAQRATLARQALTISADCADAYLLLAEEATSSLEEKRQLLEQGVAAGERALGPRVFKKGVGEFWAIFETRPYMRARAALAEALWALDRREEALGRVLRGARSPSLGFMKRTSARLLSSQKLFSRRRER
jgi:hypothetical protein